VRDLDAPRDTALPPELLTTDARELILGADIVIELMGGLEPAREYVLLALGSGADVITGNKALLATPRPRAVRAGRAGGRAALLRGRGGRRDPHHPPAPRQPRR
jgi:homoserine dehydrogenase